MSNVTTLPTSKGQFSLAPQSLEEAMRFADLLAKSNIVPKDYQGNPGNVLVAVQWGAEIGLPPLQAMQNIAVINGRPSIWGDAMLALVRGSGLLEYINEEPTDEGCTVTVKRKGEPEVVRTFTVEDAKRAGLYGKQGPWQQHPKRMMQMRARAFALRDVFADVLRGVHIAEEVQDMPAERDMGAAEVVPEKKPASRAERARAALSNNASATAPTVILDAVVKAIEGAQDNAALNAAAEQAAQLTSEADKAAARKAFAARKKHLASAEGAGANPDTGEVQAPAAEDVAKQLRAATTMDALDIAADLIREVPDDQQPALQKLLNERLQEVGTPA